MNLVHHHVGVSVADLDRAEKWYAEVLGMTAGYAFEVPPFGLRGRFVEGHGTRVELLERAGSAPGIGGQITSAMPSSLASAAACRGPAPPKAMSTKSRGSWPRWTETILRTSAIA